MILGNLAVASHFRTRFGLVENLREVEALSFPVGDRLFRFQHIRPTNHLIQRAEAQLGHQFPHFLGNKGHKVDRVSRVTRKVLPQIGILSRYARPDRCSGGRPAS